MGWWCGGMYTGHQRASAVHSARRPTTSATTASPALQVSEPNTPPSTRARRVQRQRFCLARHSRCALDRVSKVSPVGSVVQQALRQRLELLQTLCDLSLRQLRCHRPRGRHRHLPLSTVCNVVETHAAVACWRWSDARLAADGPHLSSDWRCGGGGGGSLRPCRHGRDSSLSCQLPLLRDKRSTRWQSANPCEWSKWCRTGRRRSVRGREG